MRAICCFIVAVNMLAGTGSNVLRAQSDPVDFATEIKPILASRCFACHGPDKAKGDLNLGSEESVFESSRSAGGLAVTPGQPEQSVLFQRITADSLLFRMPPKGDPLPPEEIALIKRWIEQGGEWEVHWGFRKPEQVDPPAVENESWIRNPIDRFILARLEGAGLEPAPPANRQTLIRRVYYDLIGLPPTPEQVERFVNNKDPLAYRKLVDRLLASPHYGEKWARHWLDVVRYAETNSFERDDAKPNAWRYRDYVIESFNEDKPYDRFIIEQLAGDELPNPTPESIIATGYYRIGIWDDEPADPLQARFEELDDIVSTTGQAFLGLTIGCARCHDHKIDPIPQTDYYGMVAFFHELTPYGTRGDVVTNSQTDISPPALRKQYATLNSRLRQLEESMRSIEQQGIVKMPAPLQRKTEGPERDDVLRNHLQDHLDADDWTKYVDLKERHQQVAQQLTSLPERKMALSVAKCLPEPPVTHVLMRGNAHSPAKVVQPHFPELFEAETPDFPEPVAGSHSSGQRLVFAKWIASPENRLTSRVMVNRIWQHHFGRGIVPSPNNFGQLGFPPTHPKLLDWLSYAFIERGWHIKPMHRMMLLSATYRMSSEGNEKALARDPNNNLFWRFNMRRLTAEEIRDSVLAVGHSLNETMGGHWFYPKLSKDVFARQSRPGDGWEKSTPAQRNRRSIYAHVKRSLPVPILAVFDFPDTSGSCEARFTTTQPAQALTMLNGGFLNSQAKVFAARVRQEVDSPSQRVERALELAMCRPARDEEITQGLELMKTLRQKHDIDQHRAFELYCLVALNVNAFVYLD